MNRPLAPLVRDTERAEFVISFSFLLRGQKGKNTSLREGFGPVSDIASHQKVKAFLILSLVSIISYLHSHHVFPIPFSICLAVGSSCLSLRGRTR